jgi:hypothetical protein
MSTTLTVLIEECHREDAHTDLEVCPCMGIYEFAASISPIDSGRHGHIDDWEAPSGGVEDVYAFTKDGKPVTDVPDWLREEALQSAMSATESDDLDDVPEWEPEDAYAD